jgi:hypothetical protein
LQQFEEHAQGEELQQHLLCTSCCALCCNAAYGSKRRRSNKRKQLRRDKRPADHFDAPGHEEQVLISRVAAYPQAMNFTLKGRTREQGHLHNAVVPATKCHNFSLCIQLFSVQPHPVLQAVLDGQRHRMPLLMQRSERKVVKKLHEISTSRNVAGARPEHAV